MLCEELFPVTITEDAQVIEIEITNEWVRGNLTLTEYDADYPENKLTGAVFEVYRDTNNDETWDDGDELIGTMEETSEGIYWMQDLKMAAILSVRRQHRKALCWMRTLTISSLTRMERPMRLRMKQAKAF